VRPGGARITDPTLPHWTIVGRGDQPAGLSIAILLCLVGIRLGRRLRLPNAALFRPMLLTMAVNVFGLSHGYAWTWPPRPAASMPCRQRPRG
jgi:uncharacterized protein